MFMYTIPEIIYCQDFKNVIIQLSKIFASSVIRIFVVNYIIRFFFFLTLVIQ